MTATAPVLQDLHETSKETPLKEFLAVSRTKIHPPMPDLMRQSLTGSEQQQKLLYIATSTVQRTPKGISNSLNSEQGVQPDWMFGQALLPSFTYTFQH